MGYHLRLMVTVVNNIKNPFNRLHGFPVRLLSQTWNMPVFPQSWDWICSWRIHDGEGGEGTERLDGREIMEVRCHFSFSAFYRQGHLGAAAMPSRDDFQIRLLCGSGYRNEDSNDNGKYHLEKRLEPAFVEMLVRFYPGQAGEVVKYLKKAGYADQEIGDLIDRTVGRDGKTEFLYKGGRGRQHDRKIKSRGSGHMK